MNLTLLVFASKENKVDTQLMLKHGLTFDWRFNQNGLYDEH